MDDTNLTTNSYADVADFTVLKFYVYNGPNYYLNKKAIVFNLYITPDGPGVDFYKDQVLKKFPVLEENYPDRVAELFARVVSHVNKMDLNLFNEAFSVEREDEEWVIAIEYLDDYLTEEVIYLVSAWFVAINNDEYFDFDSRFITLQEEFNKTIYGGPTIYSLIESGVKRGISVNFLYEENQFQWGYCKKQLRGRSTIFHTDGIKDTEFTSYKDMCGDFLELCGFPTPKGKNCFTQDDIIAEAKALGFPVVVKPVAGHKGQGVTTGIESIDEVKKAYQKIITSAEEEGVAFEGALVQQQIYGYDHRLLTIGGKYAAALKRVPAFVVGDGSKTIKELIDIENEKEVRLDNARSPLAKIHLDDDMIDFLNLQKLTPESIPEEGLEIVLRRVANISAGGVSINVTNEIHPQNIEMVENIARFLHVTALGIDVLAKDITKPWTDGDFGIIEINAGPGVFMHLAPAEGGSVDIPGMIMNNFFGETGQGRIPIIVGNNMTDELIVNVNNKLKEFKDNIDFGSLRKDGVYFNNSHFTNHKKHDENCKILFRNPKLDFVVVNHTKEDIYDFGIWHQGHDVAILNRPNYAEDILERDLLPGGLLILIDDIKTAEGVPQIEILVMQDENELQRIALNPDENVDDHVFEILSPFLSELLVKYD